MWQAIRRVTRGAVRRRRPHSADAWAMAGPEPRLEDLLADPIVALLMRRDGIDAGVSRAVALAARAKLRARGA